MSGKELLGIHHVTAIAGDPQRNIAFYSGILGLRLVKLTVNYDDPTTYHLYYGDTVGTPGSIITFFPWKSAQRGRQGTGQLTTTSFSVPSSSLGYWEARLEKHKIQFKSSMRFSDQVLSFSDHDGLGLELIANDADKRKPWDGGTVSSENAIRGFHSVTISEEGYEQTAWLLKDIFGFKPGKQVNNRFRYEAGRSEPGQIVDILCRPDAPRGFVSVGTIHHVAWRTPDEQQQKEWRQQIAELGLNVTPVIDRKYFHSIYFREPGGVLFEIATDPPGFTVDQPVSKLGTELVLPSWLEPVKEQLNKELPHLQLPSSDKSK